MKTKLLVSVCLSFVLCSCIGNESKATEQKDKVTVVSKWVYVYIDYNGQKKYVINEPNTTTIESLLGRGFTPVRETATANGILIAFSVN